MCSLRNSTLALSSLLVAIGCSSSSNSNPSLQDPSTVPIAGTAGTMTGVPQAGTVATTRPPSGMTTAGLTAPPPAAGSGGSSALDAGMAMAGTGGSMSAGSGGAAPMAGAGSMSDAGGSSDAGMSPANDAGSDASAGSMSSFPAVAIKDLVSSGAFMTTTKTRVGPGSGYNIYHPSELGRDGLKHPVLTWGNGATTTPDQYPLLPRLASQGFVVIAARSSFVNGKMLRDGLDWMLAQNMASGSEFEGKLDPEKVGSFGYSLGSLATFEIGTDPRLKTTVHISGGIMGSGDKSQATAVDVPTAYFCDKDETGPNCDSDFAVVDDNPTFYGRVPGAVHVDYMFNRAFIDRMNAPIIGWLRWQLMADETMAVMFEGADCTLCADRAWEVQKKNMD